MSGYCFFLQRNAFTVLPSAIGDRTIPQPKFRSLKTCFGSRCHHNSEPNRSMQAKEFLNLYNFFLSAERQKQAAKRNAAGCFSANVLGTLMMRRRFPVSKNSFLCCAQVQGIGRTSAPVVLPHSCCLFRTSFDQRKLRTAMVEAIVFMQDGDPWLSGEVKTEHKSRGPKKQHAGTKHNRKQSSPLCSNLVFFGWLLRISAAGLFSVFTNTGLFVVNREKSFGVLCGNYWKSTPDVMSCQCVIDRIQQETFTTWFLRDMSWTNREWIFLLVSCIGSTHHVLSELTQFLQLGVQQKEMCHTF